MSKEMEFHEISSIFPMMNEEEFEQLKADIQEQGLLEPIILYEGKILDGRNRYLACKELGIEPTYQKYEGSKPLEYVVSKNLKRRHLTAGQKAFIALEIEKRLAELARKQQGTRTDIFANCEKVDFMPIRAEKQAAEMVGTGSRYVSDAKIIQEKAPELAEKVKAGELNIPTAIKTIKELERKEDIERQRLEIESGKVELPEGLFEVIVIDPPWPYGTNYDANGRRVASPYPEMSIDELLNIPIPAAENSTMFLWTTHRFIWEAKRLLDHLGFEYRNLLVWDKEDIGIGDLFRMQCEFCLVGIKGKPIFDNPHNYRDIIREPGREHSRKPESFYSMVEHLCIGRKLDYFSRERREGWFSYGNDVGKFNE